jgi:transmembrane sensor
MNDPRPLNHDPLATKLRPALAPERVELVWRRIAEARHARSTSNTKRAPKLWLATGALAAAAALLVVYGPGTEPAFSKGGRPIAAPVVQPLTLSSGTALTEITTLAAARTVALSDGSQLDIAPGSRLKPLDVSDRSVLLHLVQGKARFTVKPGGPRRWVVEAGSASVEVVGTRFTVERDQGAVRVEVEEGKVLVRGAAIEDGVTRLSAGESLSVPSTVEAAPAVAPTPAPTPAIAPETAARKPAAPSRGRTRAAEAPAPKPTAVKELLPLGALDADALLALADQARMSRDYRGAIGALGRVLHEHPSDPRARLAAFTMGRIRQEELHDLAGAATAYEDALRRGLSGSLAEDCTIRLVRVRKTQVERDEIEPVRAHLAARRYLARYPSGRYAAEARQLLESPAQTGE